MGGVLAIINRPTLIDSMSDSGRKLDKVEGRVELKAVYFSYPNRADVRVLNDFSLSIEPGTTTAVVGASGSGRLFETRSSV